MCVDGSRVHSRDVVVEIDVFPTKAPTSFRIDTLVQLGLDLVVLPRLGTLSTVPVLVRRADLVPTRAAQSVRVGLCLDCECRHVRRVATPGGVKGASRRVGVKVKSAETTDLNRICEPSGTNRVRESEKTETASDFIDA